MELLKTRMMTILTALNGGLLTLEQSGVSLISWLSANLDIGGGWVMALIGAAQAGLLAFQNHLNK